MSIIKPIIIGLVATGFLIPSFSVYAKHDNKYTLKANNINIKSSKKIDKNKVLILLPELKNKEIDVKKLSKNIQVINDNGAVNIKVQFVPVNNGMYDVYVLTEDGKRDACNIGINNTGDDYTGNWRTNISYTNNGLSNYGDSLAVSYITSPNHLKEVKQTFVNYKAFLPKIGDTITFSNSYSNSDMGKIADIYGLGLYAVGKSVNNSLHYQHNIKYTRKNKRILDFGIDYKKYNGRHELRMDNYRWATGGYDFSETVLSLGYTETLVNKNNVFTYNVEYKQNINGDKSDYNNYRTGSTDSFQIVKGYINYQQYLKNKWILVSSIEGQYSNDNLLGTEQFGLGGVGSIRGLKSGAASGDKGYKLSFETYSPEIFSNSKFVLFTDFGHTFNNHNNIGETNKTLISYGLGYRFDDKKGLIISLDYAKATKHSGVSDSYRLPWHLNIVKHF